MYINFLLLSNLFLFLLFIFSFPVFLLPLIHFPSSFLPLLLPCRLLVQSPHLRLSLGHYHSRLAQGNDATFTYLKHSS